jgi:TetR/AcrR family transcriptional regulator, regulator of mycofactocin system
VARYAARRMDAAVDELGPQLAGHVALGAANAAYEQWLRDESSDLDELVHRAFHLIQVLPELTVTKPA